MSNIKIGTFKFFLLLFILTFYKYATFECFKINNKDA